MHRQSLHTLTLCAALACNATVAADGDLDFSFGDNGVARAGVSDAYPYADMLVLPDGTIATCGTRTTNGSSGYDFFVARFTADGAPDANFSFDGKTTIDFDGGAGKDQCFGVALQPDGKLIVAGSTDDGHLDVRFAVARLNVDGTLDTSFGPGTGKTTVAFAHRSDATKVAVQADGRIVVVGRALVSGSNFDFAVARLLPDGTRDPAFNLSGTVMVAFDLPGHGMDDEATSVAIDAQQRILIGGSAGLGVNGREFAAARLLPTGALDPDFDADGRAAIDFGLGAGGAGSESATIQRDGRIVLAGIADTSPTGTPNYDMALARLLPDGTPDNNFGVGGRTLVSYDLTTNGQDDAARVVEQANGSLVVVGYALAASGLKAAAARLRSDGSPDEQFGTLGKRTYEFGLTSPSYAVFDAVAFQGTRIIAAGFAAVPGGTSAFDVIVARLDNDLLFADGFE